MKLSELLPYIDNEKICVFFDNKSEERSHLYYEGCAKNLAVPDNFTLVGFKAHKDCIYILITWEN